MLCWQATGQSPSTSSIYYTLPSVAAAATMMVDVTSLTQVWSALRLLYTWDKQGLLERMRHNLILRARERYSGWEPLAETVAGAILAPSI